VGARPFYKPNHDPALWYAPLAAPCAASDLPVPASDAGLTDGDLPVPLPAYTFITPNLCRNHHWTPGCSQAIHGVGQPPGDGHVASGTVAALTAVPATRPAAR
jgi:hypothetical protein